MWYHCAIIDIFTTQDTIFTTRCTMFTARDTKSYHFTTQCFKFPFNYTISDFYHTNTHFAAKYVFLQQFNVSTVQQSNALTVRQFNNPTL